ncbi:MAG TPA: hypothetical protein PK322_01820 [Opitutaceae bacterium]|nr:hypothetical protein [Opitutaceae bacterium]
MTAAQARIAELEQRLEAVLTPHGVSRAPEVSSDGAGPADRRNEPDRRFRPGRRGGFMLDSANDPEIAPLVLKQRRRQIASRYAALFARLRLPPEQGARLQELLAEKQITHFDAMALARRQGLGRDEAQALAREADAEADAAIRALLGDGAFAQLQEFDRTYSQRAAVNTLATQLGYEGAPLTVAQQERLIGVLAARPGADGAPLGAGPFGGFDGPGGPAAPRGLGNDSPATEFGTLLAEKIAGDAETVRTAATFLAPVQVEAVRRALEEETDQLRLAALRRERMRRTQPSGG